MVQLADSRHRRRVDPSRYPIDASCRRSLVPRELLPALPAIPEAVRKHPGAGRRKKTQEMMAALFNHLWQWRKRRRPTGARLTPGKRVVLATAAAISLLVPLAAGAREAAAFAAGQLGNPLIGPAIDPESRFDVVSVKPSDPSAQLRLGMTPGRLDLTGAPVRVVMGLVLPLRRIVGWPDGIDTDRYAITAKMPDGSSQAAMQMAIRNLLKDRFKLVMHEETRELPVYSLVLARSDGRLGPALKESSAECQATVREYIQALRRGAPAQAPPAAVVRCMSSQPGVGTFGMTGTSIAALVNLLPQFVDRPVIDRTGLSGIYDLTLKWAPETGAPSLLGLPATPPPPADPDAPNIFTAVQEQLGLKLEPGRGPVEVIVIDRLEKPTFD
jgi:uncharacterized protein (TIGR03435 family)